MKKSILSALLVFAMLLSLMLAACNDASPDTSSNTDSEAPSSSTASENSSEPEKQYLVPHLGERDLDGYVLTIYACEPEGMFNQAQFAPEEENEEPVNDAVYNRNQRIMDEYNCEINVIFGQAFGEYEKKVQNDVLTGINEYNVCITGAQTLALTAIEVYFYDLLSLENSNLRLDEEWWDKSANDSMTLCDKLFFATGDITVTDDLYTTCIFFNKDMISERGLDSPYQLVYDGKWTIDVMHQMCKDVAMPGGDGVMNVDGSDTWGFVGVAFDTYKLIAGSGCPQIERGADGDPVIAMTKERNVNAFNKVYDFMLDNSCVLYSERYFAWNDPENHRVKDHFYNGQALFLCDNVYAVNSQQMLATDFNYGVIPTPKTDDIQDNYISGIDPYRFYCVSLPKTTEQDIDKTTFVLEAMAYLGKQMVTPKFYEVTLKEKRFRDDDAPKMLDTIFANRCVDLSVMYNWSDCIQYYNNMIFTKQNVLSYMESRGPGMQEAMDECIERIRSFSNEK